MTEAQPIADLLVTMPGVLGVTLGGSAASGLADADSDVDLHVYWRAPLEPPDARAARLAELADPGSVHIEITDFGLEDHLRFRGQLVELVYLYFDDLNAEAARAYTVGLSGDTFVTAFLYSLAHGTLLVDHGEVGALQRRLLKSYPAATRERLLTALPGLAQHHLHQLRLAQRRADLPLARALSVRLEGLFFNGLFALNRRYHPGEKRLLTHAAQCPLRPPQLAERWQVLAALNALDPALPATLESLLAELAALQREREA